MKKNLLFICFVISNYIFSQDVSISTKFSEDGALYDSLTTSPKTLTLFKKNEKCIVVDYVGRDNYKVQYKEWVGFLNSDFLFINEEMMDLYYDFQEKERLKVIEERENRKKRIQEIIRNSPAEREKRKKDSIVKAKELEKQRIAAQELLRKQAEEKAKRQRDSIAQVKELEKQRIAAQELLRKQAEEKARRQRDSIAQVKELERQRIATQELLRKQADEKARRQQDSIIIIKVDKKNKKTISEELKYRNTCHYVANEYDEFYKEILIRTEPYNVNNNLTIELYVQGHRKNVFFNLSEDLGCVSYLTNNKSYVKVELENNQVVTFYHSWDIDCENFNFKGRISNSQIQKLKQSPIKSLLFKGTKRTKNISDIDYKNFFIDKLKCIE